MHMQYAVVYMLHVCPWILMDSATAAFGSPRGSLVMENFSAAAPKAWHKNCKGTGGLDGPSKAQSMAMAKHIHCAQSYINGCTMYNL